MSIELIDNTLRRIVIEIKLIMCMLLQRFQQPILINNSFL